MWARPRSPKRCCTSRARPRASAVTRAPSPTLDYDPEESKRNFSISTSIAPIEHNGLKINILDAPCYPDFIGDAYAALSVAETALFVVDAAEGPQATTVKLWYAAEDLPLAKAVFVNRIDREHTDFNQTMELLQERFGNRLGAMSLPMGEGGDFRGVIDVLRMKAHLYEGDKESVVDIPAEYTQAAQEAHEHICDLVVEVDDELMEKYLEGTPLEQDELESLLGKAIAQRLFVPVYVGSAVREQGIMLLLDDVVTYFPSPLDYGEMPLSDGTMLKISSADERPVAFVFKTLSDPTAGRLSFLKVLAGTLEPSTELICARTQKHERLGHLYLMCGHDTTDVNKRWPATSSSCPSSTPPRATRCRPPARSRPRRSASPTRSTRWPSAPSTATRRTSSAPSWRRPATPTPPCR